MFFLVAFNVLIAGYFMYIGFWQVSLFPIIVTVLLILTFYDVSEGATNFFVTHIQKNLLSIAWMLIQAGLLGVMNYSLPYLGRKDFVYAPLFLIAVNMLLLLYSHLANFIDGKKIFAQGLFFIMLVLEGYLLWKGVTLSITIIAAFFTVVYSVIAFGIGSLRKVHGSNYFLFIFWAYLTIATFIGTTLGYNIAGLFSQGLIIAFMTYSIFAYKRAAEYKKLLKTEEITYEGIILEGQSLQLEPFKDPVGEKFLKHESFLRGLPEYVKSTISVISLICMVLHIFVIVKYIGATTIIGIILQLSYWMGVILCVIIFLLSKRLDFYPRYQRYLLFIVINFSIYLTLISLGKNNPGTLLFVGVIRSFVANLMTVFVSQNETAKKYFNRKDYQVWLLTNAASGLVNVYFIFKLPIDSNMKFFLMLIYMGLMLFVSHYSYTSVQQDKE